MDYTLKDLEIWSYKIEKIAREEGLDYYPQEFEIIGQEEMLSYMSYLGMPSRYPHWSFGKAYEKNKTLYSLNYIGLPYEMVINSDPCLAYLMKDNSLLLQILTMAHVYGHNDFFKNNRIFKEGTRAKKILDRFKLDSDTIRGYIKDKNIGYARVERILDAAHSIKYQVTRDNPFKIEEKDFYIEKFLEDFNKSENKEENYLEGKNIPFTPLEDILKFLIDYSDLEPWEKNILKIVRRESLYFLPQIETKIMNEGWASYWHYNLLKKLDLNKGLYIEFLKRHNEVVSPSIYGINPYYIGFKIFEDIEKRYGKEKLFEVRALERDYSFIRKYLNLDLCRELNLFKYGKRGFDYIVEEVSDELGWRSIRNLISEQCGLGSIPYIRVLDIDKRDKTLILEHVFEGRELDKTYAIKTLNNIKKLWGRRVILKSRGKDFKEIVFSSLE